MLAPGPTQFHAGWNLEGDRRQSVLVCVSIVDALGTSLVPLTEGIYIECYCTSIITAIVSNR